MGKLHEHKCKMIAILPTPNKQSVKVGYVKIMLEEIHNIFVYDIQNELNAFTMGK